MAWQELVTVQNLSQGVDSTVVRLNPGETAHVQMKRTGVCTDLIQVQVFGTLVDPAERDVVPLYAFGMRSTETVLSFIMRGVWGFVVLIVNGELVPSGTVTADLRYKKDNVDVS